MKIKPDKSYSWNQRMHQSLMEEVRGKAPPSEWLINLRAWYLFMSVEDYSWMISQYPFMTRAEQWVIQLLILTGYSIPSKVETILANMKRLPKDYLEAVKSVASTSSSSHTTKVIPTPHHSHAPQS